jgi:hypothetical protein
MNNSTKEQKSQSSANEKLYRVMIGGLYSTREQAEEQAKSAAEKGFEMSVYVVNEDFAFFGVQFSTHSDRAQAEQDKQRLINARLDAYIANP